MRRSRNAYRFALRRIGRLVFAVFLGLAVLVILAEIVLRVYGAQLRRPLYTTAAGSIADARMRILCTGDSHVEGMGVPAGLDYPSQLAGLLDQERGRGFAAVVNLGHSGFNSSQAANRAIRYLESRRDPPCLVIFQAGVNNNHNFAEARVTGAEARAPGLWSIAKYHLADMRMFHILLILVERMRHVGDQSGDRNAETGPSRSRIDHGRIRFVQDWIQRDLEALHEASRKAGARLILVNYWHPVKHIEEVFADFASRYPDVLFCNVRNFRSDMFPLNAYRIYSNPDTHPNEHGYALIAELIHRDLAYAGWLEPEPDLIPKN